MKIYTKTGDQGETSLVGGIRVGKDDIRIEAYGSIDELNCVLGVIVSVSDSSLPSYFETPLKKIQEELFQLGSELASPAGTRFSFRILEGAAVLRLEGEMDQMQSQMSELRNFILPGGTKPAALFHWARTICRRAERKITTLHRGQTQRVEILKYVNRLSDYFFVCARYANFLSQVPDTLWIPPK